MTVRLLICALSLSVLGLGATASAAPVDSPDVGMAASPVAAGPAAGRGTPVRVAQRGPRATPTNEVDRARARLRKLRAERTRLRADKARLVEQYQKKLNEIDRLKKQRASWRRDRLIRRHMSQSHGTAERLSAFDQRLRRLSAAIRKQEKVALTAIDRELRSRPTAARARDLRAWRRATGKGKKRRSAKKIILPEDEIDPLADPEELEYQASLLRQSEDQLAREIGKLEHQARRYRHMVSLRKKFRRADELARFDDDRPRRGNGRAGDRAAEADTGNPSPASVPSPPPSAPPGSDSMTDSPEGSPPEGSSDNGGSDDLNGDFSSADLAFDIVLADVVDSSTIKALRAAGVSSDPAVKAKAAEQARKQVKARIERLRKRRKLMRKRARRLRDRP